MLIFPSYPLQIYQLICLPLDCSNFQFQYRSIGELVLSKSLQSAFHSLNIFEVEPAPLGFRALSISLLTYLLNHYVRTPSPSERILPIPLVSLKKMVLDQFVSFTPSWMEKCCLSWIVIRIFPMGQIMFIAEVINLELLLLE